MGDLKRSAATGFALARYPESCHVCLIYDDEEQRRKAVSEYLAAGLARGEQIRYFADRSTPEEIRSWLAEMGVELPDSSDERSFGIIPSTSAYCPQGRFEPEKTIEGMLLRYDRAREAGYSGSCATGEMTWALKGIPGSDRLVDYEVQLNIVSSDFPHSGMCQYDARVFDGAILYKVLQVHPYMIAQGQVVMNPFYMKPEEMLPRPGMGEGRG